MNVLGHVVYFKILITSESVKYDKWANVSGEDRYGYDLMCTVLDETEPGSHKTVTRMH